MAQGDVGDRVRVAADIVRAARSRVLDAHELAADARDAVAVAMEGSAPEHHTGAVGVLSETVSVIEGAAEFAGALCAALSCFADRMGRAGNGAVLAVPAAISAFVPPGAGAAVPPGRWKGKTAKEHVLNGGVDIGRAATGSKKMPTRLLSSYAELHELFAALRVGAELADKPNYPGQFYRFPDGTTLAYRTHSRSGGDNDPTLDFTAPNGQTTTLTTEKAALKVHVNEQDGTP
ncbi:hypothetical protein [Allokutzneria sp. NRRL B-24872]|uniref:hypothetical protein n=1 Tax=Allokutzneria sp. NRRL B-24872 TaxID=1137961 RepID=UPI00117771EC|nr:hypothetical protein [Allokutzneria sp. NRRL B-24872]